jgi:hypothetical protein
MAIKGYLPEQCSFPVLTRAALEPESAATSVHLPGEIDDI